MSQRSLQCPGPSFSDSAQRDGTQDPVDTSICIDPFRGRRAAYGECGVSGRAPGRGGPAADRFDRCCSHRNVVKLAAVAKDGTRCARALGRARFSASLVWARKA
jgi:hypothetical protein